MAHSKDPYWKVNIAEEDQCYKLAGTSTSWLNIQNQTEGSQQMLGVGINTRVLHLSVCRTDRAKI